MSVEPNEHRYSAVRAMFGASGAMLCHLFALGALVAATALVRASVPWFEKVGASLNEATRGAINLSWWMRDYWFLPLLLLIPDAAIYFLLVRLQERYRWIATIWLILPLLFVIFVLVLLVGGMCLPLRA